MCCRSTIVPKKGQKPPSTTKRSLPIAGREPSALRLLEAKDTERVVRKILNELPERDRRLLQSVLLEERDKDEVCAEFGISREYLRVLLHRAKHSFKSFYIDHLGLHQGR